MTGHDSKRLILKTVLLATAAFLFGAAASASHAEAAYPNKPIRVVVPFPAGGAVDTFVRIIGPELTTQMGQPCASAATSTVRTRHGEARTSVALWLLACVSGCAT